MSFVDKQRGFYREKGENGDATDKKVTVYYKLLMLAP